MGAFNDVATPRPNVFARIADWLKDALCGACNSVSGFFGRMFSCLKPEPKGRTRTQ